MTKTLSPVLQEAFTVKEYMTELRSFFHSHPELGYEEFLTAAKIEEELTKMKIPYTKVGATGIAGTIDSGRPGKTLVLRADIDALPIQDKIDTPYKSQFEGKKHACGHDGHAAALLGAAKLLLLHRSELTGKVLLIFQPAEEIGGAAREFIDEGLLDSADKIFAIHFGSELPTGTYAVKKGECMASCDRFKAVFHGKAAHITRPQDGADALFAASLFTVQVQTLVSRLISPVENALIGVGSIHSGSTYNIIAAEAAVEGTIRAFSHEARTKIKAAVKKTAHDIAELYGAAVDIDIQDIADACINDEESADELIQSARKLVSEHDVLTNIDKRFGADNFADFMRKAHGCYVFVGSCSGPSTGAPHHNEYFDLAPDALVYAAAIHLQYTLDYLGAVSE